MRSLAWLSVIGALSLAAAAAPPAARPEPLPTPLRRLLAAPGLARQDVGVHAVYLDTGETYAAANPDRPLVLASTVKLFTTACALERLGPALRLGTLFLADAAPDAAGVLHGSLYVRGSGNPLLKGEDLWAALRELAALGVRRIQGDLVVDDGLFEPPGRPASWPERAVSHPYNAPQGALAIAWDSVEVVVLPGARPGAPARVTTSPLREVAPVVNRATTGGKTAVSVSLADAAAGRGTIVVSGTIAPGDPPFTTWIHLGQPTEVALGALAELLPQAGIALGGRARAGRAPQGARVLLEHESPPLDRLVYEINKNSSNFGAEMLLRGLAAQDGEVPATTAAGLRRVAACLAGWKIAPSAVALVDGSGFGRQNRATPRALVQLLAEAARRPEWGPELMVSLPRAGEDGSLRRRLRELRGRLRAKTGTLNGVAALAGYGTTPSGRTLAFAIVVNQARGGGVSYHAVDRIARAILVGAP
ncbi:MAG: D-alanyl-D-alanine carboxypeptidase/D-alanyl-D-alanine-endopeptidase [Acidobacteria bacterium]|nr:D-alanyl-D-alanine carboxypeptidase/D-alanyl-D-alanine-endopeptidase [Acidobacteriota bacterium]